MQETYLGFAEVDITPARPVQLVGYDVRPDNLSRGVLHHLLAQTLVWKMGDEVCCLIAVDSLGFTVVLTTALRKKVAQALSIDVPQVMVSFSHTHAAPNAALEPDYYTWACQQIAGAAICALSSMTPVRAAWGTAQNEIGANRRGDAHPFDHRLGILKMVDAATEELLVLLVRVTAHANVLTADNFLISADYFGTARAFLTRQYGCNVMLLQGAAGDVRPKYRQENADFLELHPMEAAQQVISAEEQKLYFAQSMQSLDKIAALLYQAIDVVLPALAPQPIQRLAMFSVQHQFHADVPTLARALEIAEEARRLAGIDGTSWLDEVQRLQAQQITCQSSEVEIQYFVVNDGCLCGIANEIMSEISLEIVQQSRCPFFFLNGYTNGIESYLPSAEEYDQGGYEVLWSNLLYYCYHGRVMPFNRDTAKRLEAEVLVHWQRFQGREQL